MANMNQDAQARDGVGEPPFRERQPYHWPRNPPEQTPRERRQRGAWIAATVVAFAAVVAILLFIVQWR